MSIRIKDVPPKTGEITATTKIVTEDVNDETNKTRTVPLSDSIPYTWAATDEDSPIPLGLLYTTEAAVVTRSINKVKASLKNAPTGNDIVIDIQKETGINTNVFATILSTLLTIDVNEFSDEDAAVPAVVSDGIWEVGRRLQIILVTNDSNFAATGLKGSIKS